MASRCSRIINKASISSIRSAIKLNSQSASSTTSFSSFSASTRSASSPLRRLSFSRIPSELGGVQSMLPLHNAVATARMTSCLSSTSRSCRALSQGDRMLKYLRMANQYGHYFECAKPLSNNYPYQSEVELVLHSLELA
ncbi:hypothetical protein KY290_034677 [Solanum tuberosum]|uniref:Uncharacterized protein n=1 Tax=Solanum tuberosum TaxID=4113 RepID=A0ABQ7U5W8_SOLTU|nr:hypothetical protein KY289_034047 [Solanum tuberosum]KAH0741634.1 hypothetical protein KY290_034677 [Solanum tuberosum]